MTVPDDIWERLIEGAAVTNTAAGDAIYRAGELVGTYPEDQLLGALRLEIENVIREKYPQYAGELVS